MFIKKENGIKSNKKTLNFILTYSKEEVAEIPKQIF
jgi:hypothetical protein